MAPPEDQPRSVLHVDMDAFYASVEQRDDPELRGKPVLVGGRSRRGVVMAASYEARVFGARSAMPMGEALRRVPHAVVVTPRMDRYAQASDGVFAVFRRYTPLVEPLSLDEAFLDVTASTSLFGDGAAIARAIKDDIRDGLELTASAGVAPCKFVAKVASDLRKPDGLVVVRPGEERAFLAPLPVERMWGVGPKTAPKMRALGYATLGDLARTDEDALRRAFGSWGASMARLARGEDDRHVIPDRLAKSIGAEQTYEEDLVGADAVSASLLEHSARVARRLVRADMSARTVTVKVKYADFTLVSRQLTLPRGGARHRRHPPRRTRGCCACPPRGQARAADGRQRRRYGGGPAAADALWRPSGRPASRRGRRRRPPGRPLRRRARRHTRSAARQAEVVTPARSPARGCAGRWRWRTRTCCRLRNN